MATLETIETLIYEKFNQNEKDHQEIIERLDKTNGNVRDNTAFRNKSLGAFVVIGALGVGSIFGVIIIWIKFLIQ